MPTYGPQNLPYPNTSDAPDVPGALLTLIQALGVGGIKPFTTYSSLTAGPGAYVGQLAIVTSDSTVNLNGIYVWGAASSWVLLTSLRTSLTLSMGSGYSINLGQATMRGNQVSLNVQFLKTSAITTSDTVATLPVGARPAGQFVVFGGSSNGGGLGTVGCTISTDGTIKPVYISNAAATNINLAVTFETV